MFKQKFWLTIFFIYLLFSTGLIAIGVLPAAAAYFNLAVQLAAVLLFDFENALYSMIVAIPFYLVLPNPKLDTFSQWRITFAVLFLRFWLIERKNKTKIEFFSWDKYLKYFLWVALISILTSSAGTFLGVKKILFVANVYLLYLLTFNIIREKQQLSRLLQVTLVPLAGYILFGFIQLLASFHGNIYYFWQYWATVIARPFFGAQFANTAVTSNSWFDFSAGLPALRMFSLLPDSHAFAVICMFTILFAQSAMFFSSTKRSKVGLWLLIILACLGLAFSGTRGMWLGILAPLILLLYFYAKHYGRKLIAPMFLPIIIFIAAIGVSPLIEKGLATALRQRNTDFISRAASIYDLNESSNAGRIQIWKYVLTNVVAANPILGVGYGNFSSTISSAQEKQFNLPKQYITAHSLYLDVLAELGLVGLAVFCYFFKSVLQAFWQFFKRHYLFERDGYVFFAVNSGLYIVWLLAYSFFDGTLLNSTVLMFFFIILAGAARVIKNYA